jgi:plasmid stabilization system protein ParE
MRVVFSDASRMDLRSIAVFIAGDSPARARSFVAELALHSAMDLDAARSGY